MITFPSNPSSARCNVPLPSLRTDSLWLSRPTQPLVRKSPQSPQLPPWLNKPGSPSSSYIVSNSPKLPIGGNPLARPAARRVASTSPLAEQKSPSATTSTATLLPSLQLGLDKLFADVESDVTFTRSRRFPSTISTATSASVYSQSSASHGLLPNIQDEDGTMAGDANASDTFSVRSADTMQGPPAHFTKDNVISFNMDPRSSMSTCTDTIASTLTTLVGASPPPKEKRRLESTRLSLQPCPSLASAHHILRHSDLPPDHDAPSPIDENTYRRYEHEGNADASPFSEEICADYDYIHAIDVLIYGVQPLPDVPVDVGTRQTSRMRSRREIAPIRRRVSENRTAHTGKRATNAPPPVPLNRKQRKNSVKMEAKNSAKTAEKKRSHDKRRSIFFQVTHFFGKPS